MNISWPQIAMAELQRKRNERRGHKGSATKILNQIEPAIAADPLYVPKLEQLKRIIIDKLTSVWVR